jgi:DNA-directed RNA polymerase specialized sigma24 family protein/quercetin dioxygenase-like cupin family protein
METALPPEATRNALRAPELRHALERYVRCRVPAADVDDVVQTVLCDAWAAAPRTSCRELSRWVMGIARHKVADMYRDTAARSRTAQRVGCLTRASYDGGYAAQDWLRWAETRVGEDAAARRTLQWMARESEGEKLAHIAEREQIPQAVVRQRVSRLRRRMRRWYAAELAAIAVVASFAGWAAWGHFRGDMAGPTPVVAEETDPITRESQRIASDWRARGFSCELMSDPPGTAYNDVKHENDEIIIVLVGALEVELDGATRVLRPGEELSIPRGHDHSVRAQGADDVQWLYGLAD